MESSHQGESFRPHNEMESRTLFFGPQQKFRNFGANAHGVDCHFLKKRYYWTRNASEKQIIPDPVNFLTKVEIWKHPNLQRVSLSRNGGAGRQTPKEIWSAMWG